MFPKLKIPIFEFFAFQGSLRNQLTENGFMVFTAITKDAQTYGQGTQISKDRFEMFGGVKIFFYDSETIEEEFRNTGLF